MGKIKSRIDLARSRARQRRATARRRWHNMSLRTAFICYVLIAAALSTAACMAMIKLLDEPRIALYQKYNEMAEEVKIPQGGSYRNYVTVDGAEAYIIFDSSGREVDRGEVPYGEGHIELGLGSDMRFALFIQPEYSQRDLFWTRFLAVLQVASLPICYLGGLILCAVAFWRWRLRGPIVALERASARITANDLGFSLHAERSDELGRLTESFEAMRASLDANSREMWAQMAERRKINAAFAHDLRTPLTVLKGRAAMLAEELPEGSLSGEEAAGAVRVMQKHISRLEKYVDAMARLQRFEDVEPRRAPMDIPSLAAELADSAGIICAGREVEVTSSGEERASVDVEIVLQVCENILSNASRYARKHVGISLSAHGGALTVSVSDDGPGFAPEALARASAPFYKGSESGPEHLGLGLNICDILCRRHGGKLSVANTGQGARVTAQFAP